MSQLVSLVRDGNVALIVIDNPPVNALSSAVRAGILECFRAARDDAQVAAIVFLGAGRTFVAGADITEFGKPPQPPVLIDVIAEIDQSPKPTVAAMHGTPLGGGFEVTLACHFRVAAPGTRVGLPEIKLGLFPAAGGTQRLPRLVGMDKAAAMILSGEQMPAEEALEIGLIDEIVAGDLRAGAVAFAKRVVAEKRPLRRVSELDDKIAPLRADPARFDEIMASHMKRGRGLDAPKAVVESMRQTLTLDVEEASRNDRDTFVRLIPGEQSRGQRHIFFAEREAAKVPGVSKDVKARAVRRAAVIGAGTMGGGIAMCFANAGIPVTVVETSGEALKRGLDTVAKNYKTSVTRGSLTAEEMERRIGLMSGATDMDAVKDADLVIEAVFEEMDIKRQIFGALDRITGPDAVLATNTSYLDVNAIARETQRPASVLGMHFFSPANVMRLLEVVRGERTSPEALATAMAVGRRLGKVPVVVGVCHGFVGNRMLRARSIEAERLLIEGALPQEVDGALTEFGFPMGPFAMGDLAGLDVSWRMRKAQGTRAEIADALCEAGRFGQKTGKGFYLYEAGARTGKPDPEVEAMIVGVSKRLGVTRRPIGRQEILERLVYPMVNEGARILEEGIATRPGDIDVIWIYGYGFPAWRGGPMFYADTVGLKTICERLSALATASGDKRHEPAALLQRLAAEGRGFASLDEKKSA
ncbi:MAG: 3-hydroxyacyl-CoA dehydrogenase [Bradyrhizobiaceae bacterium]|nr:MAG: 3-hydroxyacyl-CoA dehydrogenase [Bradyrhizobiaceae bacterium]